MSTSTLQLPDGVPPATLLFCAPLRCPMGSPMPPCSFSGTPRLLLRDVCPRLAVAPALPRREPRVVHAAGPRLARGSRARRARTLAAPEPAAPSVAAMDREHPSYGHRRAPRGVDRPAKRALLRVEHSRRRGRDVPRRPVFGRANHRLAVQADHRGAVLHRARLEWRLLHQLRLPAAPDQQQRLHRWPQ